MLNDLSNEPSRSETTAPKHQSPPTLASLVGAPYEKMIIILLTISILTFHLHILGLILRVVGGLERVVDQVDLGVRLGILKSLPLLSLGLVRSLEEVALLALPL